MQRILSILLRPVAVPALAGLVMAGVPAPASAEYFIGQIVMFASDYCPQDFQEANGNLLAINQNQALFSLLGTRYGGNGITTFALPRLSGQAQGPAGSAAGIALTVCIAVQGRYPAKR